MKSLAALLALALPCGLLVACSSGPAGNSGQVSASQGGSITLAGAKLSVPPGAVSGNGQLHASMAGAPPRTPPQAGTGGSELLSAVSAPVHFTVTGARLTRPVRITFRIRPGVLPTSLPAAVRADAVWLSFYDSAMGRWQAVPTQYDPAAGTATAQVRHLNWWMPWTWDWAGTALRTRQALSVLGSGRASPASCPGVPHVTSTNAGGQDPPLIGCAATAGHNTLAVSLTNNRGLTMVMAHVPADATPGPASYTGVAAFLTDHAFRAAFARRLGGAILPATETIPYSVPLHGPPEAFTASITVRSYLLDLALLAGEEGFGGITHQYLNCVLNTVLRSQVPSLTDVPGLATDCLPVLASTSPALKAMAKALGKRFLAIVTGVIIDLKLVLQTGDISYDQFRGIQGRVEIDRPAVITTPEFYVHNGYELGSLSVSSPNFPARIGLNNGAYLSGLQWTQLGTSSVTATGTLNVNNCNPSCAGGSYVQYSVRLVASDPQQCNVAVYPPSSDASQEVRAYVFNQIQVAGLSGNPPAAYLGTSPPGISACVRMRNFSSTEGIPAAISPHIDTAADQEFATPSAVHSLPGVLLG